MTIRSTEVHSVCPQCVRCHEPCDADATTDLDGNHSCVPCFRFQVIDRILDRTIRLNGKPALSLTQHVWQNLAKKTNAELVAIHDVFHDPLSPQ